MDQESKEFCDGLLNYLNTEPPERFVVGFLTPVDTKAYPHYLTKIKYPMDLGTVRQKLDNNEYMDISSCLSDILRIFYNSLEYNKEFKNRKNPDGSIQENFYYYAEHLLDYVQKYAAEKGKESTLAECDEQVRSNFSSFKKKAKPKREIDVLLDDIKYYAFPEGEACFKILELVKKSPECPSTLKTDNKKQAASKIIEKPMTFKSIETRLTNGEIKSLDTFVSDMTLVFTNFLRIYFDKEPRSKVFQLLDKFHFELQNKFSPETLKNSYNPKLTSATTRKAFRDIIDDALMLPQAYYFARPVHNYDTILPQYDDIIKHPMDLGTIQCRLAVDSYADIEALSHDYFLMCENCVVYNEKVGKSNLMIECAWIMKTTFYSSVKRRLFADLPGTEEANDKLLDIRDKIRQLSDTPVKAEISSSAKNKVTILSDAKPPADVASSDIFLNSQLSSAPLSSSSSMNLKIKLSELQAAPPAQPDAIVQDHDDSQQLDKSHDIENNVDNSNENNNDLNDNDNEKEEEDGHGNDNQLGNDLEYEEEDNDDQQENEAMMNGTSSSSLAMEEDTSSSNMPLEPLKFPIRKWIQMEHNQGSNTAQKFNFFNSASSSSSSAMEEDTLNNSHGTNSNEETIDIPSKDPLKLSFKKSSLPNGGHIPKVKVKSPDPEASIIEADDPFKIKFKIPGGIEAIQPSASQYQEQTERKFSPSSLKSKAPEASERPSRLEILGDMKMNETNILVCLRIWTKLKEIRGSAEFFEPVPYQTTPALADYPEKIKEPMDFGTIKKKLDSGSYPTLKQFYKDCRLVLKNCETFTPDADEPIRVTCNEIKKVLDKEIKIIEEKQLKKLSDQKPTAPTPSLVPEASVVVSAVGNKITIALQKTPIDPNRPISKYHGKCISILQQLKEIDEDGIFTNPFDWKAQGFYDYPEKVKNQIDLGKVEKKLLGQKYLKLEEFLMDVRLVFENTTKFFTSEARKPNIMILCRELSRQFESLILKQGLYPSECDKPYLETWRDTCKSILEQMMVIKGAAKIFAEPVRNVSNYADIVKRPMHLRKIQASLKLYETPFLFAEDVRQVFFNALIYHETEETKLPIRSWAKQFLELFRIAFARMLNGEREIEFMDKNKLLQGVAAIVNDANGSDGLLLDPTFMGTLSSNLSQEEQELDKIIKGMLKLPIIAETFKDPVLQSNITKEFRDAYLAVVEKPMDLKTIHSKLFASKYAGNREEFAQDMELMFSNAEKFNSGDDPFHTKIRYTTEYAREVFLDFYSEMAGADPIDRNIRRKKRFELIKNLHAVRSLPIRKLTNRKLVDINSYFATPVNPREYPDYLEIVKNPMDLGTIARKVGEYKYGTYGEFEADVRLVFENCFTYNRDIPENQDIRYAATKMIELFEDVWGEFTIHVAEFMRRDILVMKERRLFHIGDKDFDEVLMEEQIKKKPRSRRVQNGTVDDYVYNALGNNDDEDEDDYDDYDEENDHFDRVSEYGEDDDDEGGTSSKYRSRRIPDRSPRTILKKRSFESANVSNEVGSLADYSSALPRLIDEAQKRARRFKEQTSAEVELIDITSSSSDAIQNFESDEKEVQQSTPKLEEQSKSDHMDIEIPSNQNVIMVKQLAFLKKKPERGFFMSNFQNRSEFGLKIGSYLSPFLEPSSASRLSTSFSSIHVTIPVSDYLPPTEKSEEKQAEDEKPEIPQRRGRRSTAKDAKPAKENPKDTAKDTPAITPTSTVQVWLTMKTLISRPNGKDICLYSLVVGKSTHEEEQKYLSGFSFQAANGAKIISIKGKDDQTPDKRPDVDIEISQLQNYSYFEAHDVELNIKILLGNLMLNKRPLANQMDIAIDESLAKLLSSISWQSMAVSNMKTSCLFMSKPTPQLRGLRPFSALYVICPKDSLQFSIEGSNI